MSDPGIVLVPLSRDEVERVIDEGKRRILNALYWGRDRERFNASYNCIEGHILGAASELAASKFLGSEWDPLRHDFNKAEDVSGFEVRFTKRAYGEFKSRYPHEPLSKVYVGVGIAAEPWTFRIVGWLTGREAQDRGSCLEVNGWPAAYFVPEEKWNPFPWEQVKPWRDPSSAEKIQRAIDDIRRRRA